MKPLVSVVISVFNAQDVVGSTIDSILSQSGPDFELIVVDDGSVDNTRRVVEQRCGSADNARLLRSPTNLGLTRSLIRGCQEARGKYIARADAGDLFLPGRLLSQFELLEARPDVGVVSCGTRFGTEDGRHLYTISQREDELRQGLAGLDLDRVKGPSHHGSTMFRRDVYDQVGGYRACFRVAQDLDLWLRMHEVAGVLSTPEVFYESRMSPGDISVTRRGEQLRTAELILEGAMRRRAGLSEPDYESRLKEIPPSPTRTARSGAAHYAYFVGGCLAQDDPAEARRYFKHAWALAPLNLRYGARYLSSLVR